MGLDLVFVGVDGWCRPADPEVFLAKDDPFPGSLPVTRIKCTCPALPGLSVLCPPFNQHDVSNLITPCNDYI